MALCKRLRGVFLLVGIVVDREREAALSSRPCFKAKNKQSKRSKLSGHAMTPKTSKQRQSLQ